MNDDASSQNQLTWTGERLVPGCERPLAYEHLHRYAIACPLAAGRRVLDIASGEGYGTALLARFASDVIGIDKDAVAITHAAGKYRRHNLRFVRGVCSDIPCEDNSIDLAVSFETIEHISHQEQFIGELKRVLAPDGVLIISSPDRTEYQQVSAAPNRFHKNELTHGEFFEMISARFRHCESARQRLVAGSWIAPAAAGASAATFSGDFDEVQVADGVYRGVYSIAICSNAPLPQLKFGVFEDYRTSAEIWQLLGQYDSPAGIAERIAQVDRQLAEQIATHASETATAAAFANQQAQHIFELQQSLEAASEIQRAQGTKLLDAGWEILTLRGAALRASADDVHAQSVERIAELEARVEGLTTEREELRRMVKALQKDLDSAHYDVDVVREELQLAQTSASRSSTGG